jgi:hypothetical protein
MSQESNNQDKKSGGRAKTRARTTTPTYNASGIKAPRYNVKGMGKMGWSLGGLKGAQVAPQPGQGSEQSIAKSIGGALTGLNSGTGKRNKG